MLAFMMSVMNLSWFLACFCIYAGGMKFENSDTYDERYLIGFEWFACSYGLLFGLSHWIFVMNYLTLALRLKNTK